MPNSVSLKTIFDDCSCGGWFKVALAEPLDVDDMGVSVNHQIAYGGNFFTLAKSTLCDILQAAREIRRLSDVCYLYLT